MKQNNSYVVKEKSTEEGESLQSVETVEEHGDLDNEDRVFQVLAKHPGDYLRDPGQAHDEEEFGHSFGPLLGLAFHNFRISPYSTTKIPR